MADAKLPQTNEEYVVDHLPEQAPTEDCWRIVKKPISELKDGEFMVQSEYISVDPYMRWWMRNSKPGDTQHGFNVSVVIASKNAAFPIGAHVQGVLPWSRYNVISTANAASLRIVDPKMAPLSTAIGVLGMPGMTAYWGVIDVCKAKAGETFVVSTAAGAVGSAAGQIAKLLGCRVVGVTGGPEKVEYITKELGFDVGIDYHKHNTYESMHAALAAACPKGIDCYFDNTGGYTTDAVFDLINDFARVAACGQIAIYNDKDMNASQGPRFMHKLIYKNASVIGFLVGRYMARSEEFFRDMAPWVQQGKVKYKETVVEGFEQLPKCLIGLFTGSNIGKMLLKV